MRVTPWPAEDCIQTAGSLALEKKLMSEGRKRRGLPSTLRSWSSAGGSSSADTVVLGEQIFRDCSSSVRVRRAWQIADCCV